MSAECENCIILPKVVIIVEWSFGNIVDCVQEAVADVNKMGYKDYVKINKTGKDIIVMTDDLKVTTIPDNYFYVVGYEW